MSSTLFTIGVQESEDVLATLTVPWDEPLQLVLDIRLWNNSKDERTVPGRVMQPALKACGIEYEVHSEMAPNIVMLKAYHAAHDWEAYTRSYVPQIQAARVERTFKMLFTKYERICLLCVEPTAEKCHRRLLAEYVQRELARWNRIQVSIVHL